MLFLRKAAVVASATMMFVGATFMQPAGAQSILVVSATGTDCHGNGPVYTSIQVAVNGALPGSTILICPGVYAEQVIVTQNNLTIHGSNQDAQEDGNGGSGLTVLRPSALPLDPGSPISGKPRKAILLVDGATGVTVANLTIDGSVVDTSTAKFPSCNQLGFNVGIYYRNSAGTVAFTHTTNIMSALRCSAGIFAESGSGGTAKVAVIGNSVDHYGSDGVVCNGQSTACTVIGNTLRGRGPVNDYTQFGIEIRAGAVGQVRFNSVIKHLCADSSCGLDLINASQALGIFLQGAGSGSDISENYIVDNDAGILQFLGPECCTISENHLTNNRAVGIAIQDSNGATSENKITGGQIGIAVLALGANAVGVLRGDEITGTSVAPVKELACCGFTAKAIVTKE